MKVQKIFLNVTLAFLIISVFFSEYQLSQASFEIGEIENKDDWFISSNLIDFSEDFRANLNFGFEDESLGIGLYPYLTIHTGLNIPLNFTGYLNREIKKESSVLGIQASSNEGNITLGFNGTVIVNTPLTDVFLVEIEEGENKISANFDSLIGENLSLPLNFNPIIISVDDINNENISSVSLSLTPEVYLEGSISLSAYINNEKLVWRTGDEIYFDEVEILEDLIGFAVHADNITFGFEDVSLVVSAINTTVALDTALGTVVFNYRINLDSVEWIEGQQAAGEFIVFLISNIFNIDNQEIVIIINQSSFPFMGIPIILLLFSGLVLYRKRKRK